MEGEQWGALFDSHGMTGDGFWGRERFGAGDTLPGAVCHVGVIARDWK